MTCPKCGSGRVRLSSTAKPEDRLEALEGKVPLRCRECGRRFYYSTQETELERLQKAVKVRVDRPDSKSRRRKLAIQLAFAVFALLAAAYIAKTIVEFSLE
jgi:transcriptional regulator NrdR family protein